MKDYKFTIDGEKFSVSINSFKDRFAFVTVNGVDYKVEIEQDTPEEAPAVPVSRHEPDTERISDGTKITSPLPGVIVEVSVIEKQRVKAGDKVAVLEAMKMENEITAPKDGVVSSVAVKKGDSVLEGDTIVVL